MRALRKNRDQDVQTYANYRLVILMAITEGDMMSHFINVIRDTITVKWFLKVFPIWWWLPVTFCSVFITMFSISIPLTCFVLRFQSFWMLNVIPDHLPAKAAASWRTTTGSRLQSMAILKKMMHGQKVVKRSLTMNTLSCRNLMLWMTSCNPVLQSQCHAYNTWCAIIMNLLNSSIRADRNIDGLCINGVSGSTVGMIVLSLQA